MLPSSTRGCTILENLVLVDALAQQLTAGKGGFIDRHSGRHSYDVYQLLGDLQVLDLLADRDQSEQVMRSVEEVSWAFVGGDGIEVRPEGGFGTRPALTPPATSRPSSEPPMSPDNEVSQVAATPVPPRNVIDDRHGCRERLPLRAPTRSHILLRVQATALDA